MSEEPRKVLVVDDESAIRAAIAEMLALHGFSVETAADGAEALEVAHRFHPDALVLDVMMPGENGYRVSRALKSRPGDGAAMPPFILLVTARRLDDDPEREEMFLRFSMADELLYKPFRLDEILARLRQRLG